MEETRSFTDKYLHTVSNFDVQHYQHCKSVNISVFASTLTVSTIILTSICKSTFLP